MTLAVDGTDVATESVTVDGEGAETVRLSHRVDTPGTYEMRVDGVAAGALPVLGTEAFSLVEASLKEGALTAGESVRIEATVENPGVDRTETVELIVDGDSVGSREVSLAAGERTTVTLTTTPEAAGEYDLALVGDGDRLFERSVTVAEPAGPDDSPTDESRGGGDAGDGNADEGTGDGGTANDGADDETPGFGARLAILALAGAALARARRGR